MAGADESAVREALDEQLAESLAALPQAQTARLVPGTVQMPGKVAAVVGMRRAGKTTFVHQLRREWLEGGASLTQLPFINFEDERLAGMEAGQLRLLQDHYARMQPDALAAGGVLWCFDEIQNVPGWERFVRRLLDRGDCDIVITGSSAALLSRELATALRGRGWETPLYPFSFAEALIHADIDLPKDATAMTAKTRGRIEHAFQHWLTVGGFPEVQAMNEAERRQALQDYVDVAMLRDVVERHDVSNVQGLRWLVRHLMGNAGSPFSVEKFHGALKSQGIAVGRDTLHQLLAYLEDCFLVRTVWMAANSERQRMVNPRKAYPVDPGLIPVYDRTGRSNIGHALETAVLIELQRNRCEVNYVRTPAGYEVDFLARYPDGAEVLIQVCADASGAETAQRELRALVDAGDQHPRAQRLLLTAMRDGLPREIPEGVTALPAYAWMLQSTKGSA